MLAISVAEQPMERPISLLPYASSTEHIIYQRTVLLDDTKYESSLCTSPLDLLSSKTSGTFEKKRALRGRKQSAMASMHSH